MMENTKYSCEIYIMKEFRFDYGRVLNDMPVEYATRGTPEYDDDGNITNAFIFCHRFNGNYSSFDELGHLVGPDSILSDYNFFYISITSLGFPESSSPSTSGLRYEYPQYSILDCVNFKRRFLAEKFNIKNVLGILGVGFGGYEAFTWACEYRDEMEFLIIGNSAFKTDGTRYIFSKAIDAMISSSDDYYDEDIYSQSISRIMVSINRLIFSQLFSKEIYHNLSLREIDALMDEFADEGMFTEIYDLKYRNDAVLEYNVEDKLTNITAKTLIVSDSQNTHYTLEYDTYPLEEKIENISFYIFNGMDFFFSDDYSEFFNVFIEFLEEFKK